MNKNARGISPLLCVLSLACSPKQYVIRQAADVLSGTGDSTVWSGDDDPEMVRDAMPFALKTMESMLDAQPDHVGLHAALASGFTQYGYAFVHQDGDYAEPRSLAEAKRHYERAKGLYRRAHAYAMEGLELRHKGFSAAFTKDATRAVGQLQKADVELAYWAALSEAALIVLSKDQPDVVAELPSVGAIMNRLLVLDESFNSGGVHSFMVSYESRSEAMGGSPQRAREHHERALELTGGNLASVYVTWAEQQCVAKQDRKCFDDMLGKALAVDINKVKGFRLENVVSQRRARWLKSRVDDLIDTPMEESQP